MTKFAQRSREIFRLIQLVDSQVSSKSFEAFLPSSPKAVQKYGFTSVRTLNPIYPTYLSVSY